jgi:hypothetical protein
VSAKFSLIPGTPPHSLPHLLKLLATCRWKENENSAESKIKNQKLFHSLNSFIKCESESSFSSSSAVMKEAGVNFIRQFTLKDTHKGT